MNDYYGKSLQIGDNIVFVNGRGALDEGTIIGFTEDSYEDEHGSHPCDAVTVRSKFYVENDEGDLYNEIDNVSPFQCIKKEKNNA